MESRVDTKGTALGRYRVLDLTDETGVFCTKVLGALGADVIRIERPGGDRTRRIGPFYHDEPGPERSLHWFNYNLNKRSITLNLESTTGQDLFRALVKKADFVVESFRPGYLDGLGLGYRRLSAVNPAVIVTSITPFGSDGPYSQFKGSNLVTSAMGGFLYLCGEADRPPVQIATPVAHVQTGLEAASATLIAHWYRRRTGQGQHVDVSAQECIMGQIVTAIVWWKSLDSLPVRSRLGISAGKRPVLLELLPCKDGWIVCHTTYARGRQALREWLATERMEGDLFDKEWDHIFLEGAPVDKEQRRHIDALFGKFALRHTMSELMEGAQKRGIQVAKVSNVAEVIRDPQLQDRGYFVKVAHPELQDHIAYPGAPFKSEKMKWQYYRRAPFVGEHNVEIYQGELGLGQSELATLTEGGVI